MADSWHVRAFCACGFDAGAPFCGEIWFVQQRFPVCPDCGESSRSFQCKTVRRVRDGWFKSHYETKGDEPAPLT